MDCGFPFSTQQKDKTINKTDDKFNRLSVLLNQEKAEKTRAVLLRREEKPLRFGKVILEDGREFLQEVEEDGENTNKETVLYRRKATTTSYGRHQQRLQQKRQRKALQEIHLKRDDRKQQEEAIQNLHNKNNRPFISNNLQNEIHQHQHQHQHQHHPQHQQLKIHQKKHQQFYVAKSLLGQPQKQFQERVQRRQIALFLYRQWQLQVRQEFEDLEKIHQNILLSSPELRKTMMKKKAKIKGNLMARPIQMMGPLQKIIRRPSIIIRDRKKEVKTSEMRRYLNLLETDIVSNFLDRDSCYRLSDKYLLAATFVYFKRALYPLEKYTPRNFFVSLYLANDMEEDEEDLKYEIFPWAIGHDWPNRIQEFLKERDQLFQEIGQRGVVSRICCEEVMAIIPNSKIWLRNRLLHHAGGVRNLTIFINPTLEKKMNPHSNDTTTTSNSSTITISSSGVHFNTYCGIVEPVQPFLMTPDVDPVPCFLCHPELAPTPPKHCPLLSLVLHRNPSIQGQSQQRDPQNTKVVRCFTTNNISKSDSDFSITSSSDNDDDDDDDEVLSLFSETSPPLD